MYLLHYANCSDIYQPVEIYSTIFVLISRFIGPPW